MSTLEALNAISEAIQAHAKLPEVERSLKEAREAHDYALLELDDAKAEIERAKVAYAELAGLVNELQHVVREQNETITELRERNTSLDASLSDVTRLYNDAQSTISERNLQIDSLRLTVDSLQSRLEDSKSYGTKLAETLKSIGASIVAAVEVPEVASEKPFPVSNPVGLPTTPNFEVGLGDGYGISDPVAESPVSTVVVVAEDNYPSFNTPNDANSSGCHTAPIAPTEKLWWER
jgi:ABC-type transporter Mla subunit MlaD